LEIGWGSRDMTPPRPCTLFGQFYLRLSEGAADPLTVTALALEGTGKNGSAILLSCDLVAVFEPVHARLREEIRRRLPDFDADLFLAAATHTHCGPSHEPNWYPPQGPGVMTEEEAADWFVARAAEAAEEAWKNRAPGAVGWAYTHAVVGHNRRAVYKNGAARMYGKTRDEQFECFEGYEDHGLDLLATWDPAGRLTGVVVNVACPSQVSEHEMQFTADFWHETRQELRSRLGKGLFVLPQCAPAGDQSPHLLLHKDLEKLMWQRRGVSQRREIGRRIASAVQEALPVAQADPRSDVAVRHHFEMLPLPIRMVTPQERDQARAELARLEADPNLEPRTRFAFLYRACRTVERFEEQKTSTVVPVELHVLRVGDVAMATNPFECFLDYALRMKALSPAVQTFCVQLACGYQGYLPTARAVAGGHYGAEVASNSVGPEGGQELVDRTVEVMNGLWA